MGNVKVTSINPITVNDLITAQKHFDKIDITLSKELILEDRLLLSMPDEYFALLFSANKITILGTTESKHDIIEVMKALKIEKEVRFFTRDGLRI